MPGPINGEVIPATRPKERVLDQSDSLEISELEENSAGVTENNSDLVGDEEGLSTIFINNDYWRMRVAFNNFDKKVKPFVLQNSQIAEIAFEHNITGLDYLKGYITIRSKRIGNLLFNDELNTEFVFRGDGKDEVYLDLKPQYNADPNKFPEEIWFTKLDFVIYNIEDIPVQDGHYKRVHFWHKPYHILKTRHAPFSTADYLATQNNTDISQLNNEDRKIYTGDAIRHILRSVGLENFIDTDNWDRGSSKIFHTSFLNNSAETEITYLLQHHTSEEGDHPCLFYYNRGINKFQLLPLPTFFEKAVESKKDPGEYQLEHFWIVPTNAGLEDAESTPIQRAPLRAEDIGRFDRDIKIRSYSFIGENEYTLVDMSGNDSMQTLISRPVHTYNHDSKEFLTFVPDNDITNVKQYFSNNYTSNLFPVGKSSPLFVLNKDKTDNVVNYHAMTPFENKSVESLLNYGRNFITQSAVFLNLGISFSTNGSTHRHPGRFIAIEKNRNTENKYDYKLLGQWMVTKVAFTFRKDKMTNYLTAVKVNTYGDLKFNEDV